MGEKTTKSKNNGATLGIENELWEAADKLRGHLDAVDYKSVVLGLILLKYISDLFEQVRAGRNESSAARTSQYTNFTSYKPHLEIGNINP